MVPARKATLYESISFCWNQWDNSEPSITCKKQYSVYGLFMTSEEKHIENPFKIPFNAAQGFLFQLNSFVQYAKAPHWSQQVAPLFLILKSVIPHNIASFTMPNGLIPL